VKQQISNKMCYFTLIRVHFRAKTWIRIKRIRIRYTDNNLLHFIFRSKRSRADWGEEEEGVRARIKQYVVEVADFADDKLRPDDIK